jgi:hypothetical protein
MRLMKIIFIYWGNHFLQPVICLKNNLKHKQAMNELVAGGLLLVRFSKKSRRAGLDHGNVICKPIKSSV